MLKSMWCWTNLRFSNPVLEDEFVGSRAPDIFWGLRISSGVIFVLGLGMVVLTPHHFLPGHHDFPERYLPPRILAFGCTWFAIVLSAVVHVAASRLLDASEDLGRGHCICIGERLACGAMALAVVLPTLMNWECASYLFGSDPSAVWGRQYAKGHVESQILLCQVGILVSCSFMLPIRVHVLWPLHALAFLMFPLSTGISDVQTSETLPRAAFVAAISTALLVNSWRKEQCDRAYFSILRERNAAQSTHESSKEPWGEDLKKVEYWSRIPALSVSASFKEEQPCHVFGRPEQVVPYASETKKDHHHHQRDAAEAVADAGHAVADAGRAERKIFLSSYASETKKDHHHHHQRDAAEAVADAGHAVADAGHAVVDAGHAVADAVADAGHAVADAGHAVVDALFDGVLDKTQAVVDTIGDAVAEAVGFGSTREETKSVLQMLFGEDVRLLSVQEARFKIKMATLPFTQQNSFQIVIGLLIVMNAASAGFQADYGEENEHLFLILENIFTAVFTLEMFLKFRCESVRGYFKDSPNYLDFFCVMISIVDCWILTPLGSNSKGMRMMTVLRMIRLIRLVRLVRLFKIARELRIIAQGLSCSAKTLFWTGTLLIIFLYMAALVAVELFGRASKCEDMSYSTVDGTSQCDVYKFTPDVGNQYKVFGTVPQAMLTLYACTTEGCGTNIMKPMVFSSPLTFAFWFVFMFLASFGLLNVVIGLLCESIIEASDSIKKEMNAMQEEKKMKQISKMCEMFEAMDEDKSGFITREEYLKAIENDDVGNVLEILELDDEGSVFDILDVKKSGSVSIGEFFHGMMLLCSGNEELQGRDAAAIFLTVLNSQKCAISSAEDIKRAILDGCEEAKESNSVSGASQEGSKEVEGLGSSCRSAPESQSRDHSSGFKRPAEPLSDSASPENWANHVAFARDCIEGQEGGLQQSLNSIDTFVAQGMGCSEMAEGLCERLSSLEIKMSQSYHAFKVQEAQNAKKQVAMMGDIITALSKLG